MEYFCDLLKVWCNYIEFVKEDNENMAPCHNFYIFFFDFDCSVKRKMLNLISQPI